MAQQTTAQMAKISGMYRCTALGETVFRYAGQALPPCNCDEPGAWEFRKEDNLNEGEITILVGKGIIHAIVTDEIPEVDKTLNLRTTGRFGLPTGLYRIVSVNDSFPWMGKKEIHVEVERIEELSDRLPVHTAVPISC